MCGIAGIFSYGGKPVLGHEVRAMCSAIVHRGPDDEGLYLGSGVGLGMRRLSIIDLDSGRQPVRNEDGSVWVVFNGEIYNFRELVIRLRARGHRFYTRSDTETIVHLYEEYGDRCVDHMRGMFAFALWDEKKRRLLLARDRLGIKPLYYADVGGRLLFGSEIKALLELQEVERRLNWDAVAHCLSYLVTPPNESAIAGVHKLPPAHLMTASADRPPAVSRYWDLHFEPDYGKTEKQFIEGLREHLEESVCLHLISDVPLGAFLSGGIDSSSVVASAARQKTEPLKTFSIGFAEQEFNELGAARRVAEAFHTDHHELVLQPDILERLDHLAWHLDEPFGDSSAIATYMVSQMAAQHVKVVLSGDGGDELFAGYDKYVVEQRERSRAPLPAPARKMLAFISRAMPEGMRGRNFLRHASRTGFERYLDASTFFRREELRRLFEPEIFAMLSPEPDPGRGAEPDGLEGRHWLTRLQYLDIQRYLPLDILTKVDRMSMAHSIETRVPLLDHKLVEFAATIPPEMQMRNGTTKYILKRAMRGILPDEIINRPKHGFAVPLRYWFRNRLSNYARELLLSAPSRRRGVFNQQYVEKILHLHEKGRDFDLQLWTLISFELWSRAILDRGARTEVAA
ncbi:MAG TPA: asparagine synthase (glutamine-hydrolyzing) [Bryobacterales bacterium]|jgi:asparagine synthase (glutamine-hydrolysing)|nr:asparagine synthase (glutamine-hydrolyzing) [Bryobacterales bacterium]